MAAGGSRTLRWMLAAVSLVGLVGCSNEPEAARKAVTATTGEDAERADQDLDAPLSAGVLDAAASDTVATTDPTDAQSSTTVTPAPTTTVLVPPTFETASEAEPVEPESERAAGGDARTASANPTPPKPSTAKPAAAKPSASTPTGAKPNPARPNAVTRRAGQTITVVETYDATPPTTGAPNAAPSTTAAPVPTTTSAPAPTTTAPAPPPSVGPWTQIGCRPLNGPATC